LSGMSCVQQGWRATLAHLGCSKTKQESYLIHVRRVLPGDTKDPKAKKSATSVLQAITGAQMATWAFRQLPPAARVLWGGTAVQTRNVLPALEVGTSHTLGRLSAVSAVPGIIRAPTDPKSVSGAHRVGILVKQGSVSVLNAKQDPRRVLQDPKRVLWLVTGPFIAPVAARAISHKRRL